LYQHRIEIENMIITNSDVSVSLAC